MFILSEDTRLDGSWRTRKLNFAIARQTDFFDHSPTTVDIFHVLHRSGQKLESFDWPSNPAIGILGNLLVSLVL